MGSLHSGGERGSRWGQRGAEGLGGGGALPVQGVLSVPCSPKVLEVAKHYMGRPAT